MKESQNLQKLVDFIILNSTTMDSVGLYNGKAGIALCLFEVSRIKDDQYIEDYAFDLLKECLARETIDLTFENGTSGIGFVLLYLINNNFIDADFEKLFGQKLDTILARIVPVNKNTILKNYKVVFFLQYILLTTQSHPRVFDCICIIIEVVETYLSDVFENWTSIHHRVKKHEPMEIFRNYLRAVGYGNLTGNSEIIDKYCRLYQSGWIASSMPLGYYLRDLANENPVYRIVSDHNIIVGKRDIMLDILSLPQKIELAYLLDDSRVLCTVTSKITRELNVCNKHIDQIIYDARCSTTSLAGYESGIARLLLYNAYKNERKHGASLRFQSSFQ